MKKTKWYLVVNPVAGNGKGKKRWPSIQKLLNKTGIAFEFGLSEHTGHAIELAKNAVLAGYTKIAAVGGDGTANEVVNGMFEQDQVPTQSLTFAIIPVGTGNDWIRTHKIPKNYKKATLLLGMENTQPHDVGKVFYHTAAGEKKHRYFINVAGLAYDAFVTEATKVRPKWWGNNSLYYLYLIVSCVTQFKPTPIKVFYDDKEMEHAFFNITVGQCMYNGGGTKLVPHADPSDGLFALTFFKDISAWEMIFKAHKFYNGSITKHKEAIVAEAKYLRFETPANQPTYLEVDGECLGQTPIEFFMLEKAFNVIVP